MEPPYAGERQQWLLDLLSREPDRDENDGWRLAIEEHEAGGGSKEDMDRAIEIVERENELARERIRNNEHYHCEGGPFYVAIGRKPGRSRSDGRPEPHPPESADSSPAGHKQGIGGR